VALRVGRPVRPGPQPGRPGHEVAGTVVALGYGTTGLAVGDEVFSITDWYRDGTLAEYVAVEARDLAPRPASLPGPEATAVPMAGLTAWEALFTLGSLSDRQAVLINGAGGGVGTMAVQLARLAGAPDNRDRHAGPGCLGQDHSASQAGPRPHGSASQASPPDPQRVHRESPVRFMANSTVFANPAAAKALIPIARWLAVDPSRHARLVCGIPELLERHRLRTPTAALSPDQRLPPAWRPRRRC